MRKTLAVALTICLGAIAIGCEEAVKPKPPEVPKSDLGAPAKPGDKPATPPTTAPATK
jgi:hypothetical protein